MIEMRIVFLTPLDTFWTLFGHSEIDLPLPIRDSVGHYTMIFLSPFNNPQYQSDNNPAHDGRHEAFEPAPFPGRTLVSVHGNLGMDVFLDDG